MQETQQKHRPRRPGRPTQSADADMRTQVLDAAIAVFSERGVIATPLRAIAMQAGVTPALLHYYFGSKDSMIEALLDERIAPFIAVSTAPLQAPTKSPCAALLTFLERHMRNIAAHPWLPRLMVREVLSDGGVLRERIVKQFSGAIAKGLIKLIEQAQALGEIRADLDPRLLSLSLVSLAVFPFATAPIWRDVFKAPASRVNADSLIAHTLILVRSALEVKRVKTK
jgi:TetR/AcrR family transcriptional regulator